MASATTATGDSPRSHGRRKPSLRISVADDAEAQEEEAGQVADVARQVLLDQAQQAGGQQQGPQVRNLGSLNEAGGVLAGLGKHRKSGGAASDTLGTHGGSEASGDTGRAQYSPSHSSVPTERHKDLAAMAAEHEGTNSPAVGLERLPSWSRIRFTAGTPRRPPASRTGWFPVAYVEPYGALALSDASSASGSTERLADSGRRDHSSMNLSRGTASTGTATTSSLHHTIVLSRKLFSEGSASPVPPEETAATATPAAVAAAGSKVTP